MHPTSINVVSDLCVGQNRRNDRDVVPYRMIWSGCRVWSPTTPKMIYETEILYKA